MFSAISNDRKGVCRTCGQGITLGYSKRWTHVLTGSIFCYGAGVLYKTARPR